MKKALTFIALLLVISLKGQKDSLGHALRLNACGLHLGAVTINSPPLSHSAFAQLAPKDTSIQKDLSSFQQSGINNLNAFHFDIYASFIPKNKKGGYNSRIEFRIGFIYQNAPTKSLYFNRTSSTRVDTFSSPTTGMTVYKDSSAEDEYSFIYRGQKAGLDLCNTFQLNKHPVFHVYAGYNICFFYSYDNYVSSGYSDGDLRRGWFGKRRSYSYQQTTHLQNNSLLSASIPVGCTIRMSRKKSGRVYRRALNAELRVGLTEDKLDDDYLDLKPWFVATVGFKLFRNKIWHYND